MSCTAPCLKIFEVWTTGCEKAHNTVVHGLTLLTHSNFLSLTLITMQRLWLTARQKKWVILLKAEPNLDFKFLHANLGLLNFSFEQGKMVSFLP